MPTGKYQWPADADDRVLVEPVQRLAEEWGIPPASIYDRRAQARRRAGLPVDRPRYRDSPHLDADTLKMVRELEPIVAAEFRARGLPVKRLESWQVIAWALSQALTQAKRSNVRALYTAKKDDSQT